MCKVRCHECILTGLFRHRSRTTEPLRALTTSPGGSAMPRPWVRAEHCGRSTWLRRGGVPRRSGITAPSSRFPGIFRQNIVLSAPCSGVSTLSLTRYTLCVHNQLSGFAADWFVTRFSFDRVAYRGLETGDRNVVSHVVRQGKITFVFSSPLNPDSESSPVFGQNMWTHLAKHGDGVKDVSFAVEDCQKIFDAAVARGATVIEAPHEEEDADGKVKLATIATYGDTVHTFVERAGYSGIFLPNFRAVEDGEDPLKSLTPPIGLDFIDHVVGNMAEGEMEPSVSFYEKVLQFHRFWSADDKQIHTEYSSLRSVVVADYDEVIKMPINEPAAGKRKSQIQEYVDYYGGNGVQHIALNTRDIISAVTNLRARGVKFLKVPEAYYARLDERLAASDIKVAEDMATIRSLNILVDFDERGYLLQLFTSNVLDRPTVFLEIIQREGNTGFGAGNFKSLFEAIEREQAARGNLTVTEPAAAAASASAAASSADA